MRIAVMLATFLFLLFLLLVAEAVLHRNLAQFCISLILVGVAWGFIFNAIDIAEESRA